MSNYSPTVKGRHSLGDRVLVVAELTGDGSATGVTAASLGLSYIDYFWSMDVDDDAQLGTSDYTGSSITIDAITNTKKQLIFVVGY